MRCRLIAVLVCGWAAGCAGATDPAVDATSDTPAGGAADASGSAAPFSRHHRHPSAPGAPDLGTTQPLEAMWLWDHTQVTSASSEKALLSFAVQHRVNRLYVQSQSLLSSSADQASLTQLLDDANQRGISVELLFGDASWALAANHATAIALAQQAVTFTSSLKGPKPVAVHFDVEPNTLSQWSTDETGTANQFLDLLDALKQTLAGSGLALNVDFNYTYATKDDITRSGITKRLSQWVAAATDGGVVMTYRDQAAGSDGIVALSMPAASDWASAGKPFIIGVNTACNRPSGTSFCPDGEAALEAQLAATVSAFSSGPALAGVAVHDYTAWIALKP